jgi:putative restriction endonuclease
MEMINQHDGDESELAQKLNFEPTIPEGYVHDPKSQDGKDRIAEAKVRIGQRAFRKMILGNYNNRCCITGLDIPAVNRASHIIGWADSRGKSIRMDQRNGLCLSATYDAAFDRHLISLDDNYRIILSKEIKDHYSSQSVQAYFESKEGDEITLPHSYLPKKSYLQRHREKGVF